MFVEPPLQGNPSKPPVKVSSKSITDIKWSVSTMGVLIMFEEPKLTVYNPRQDFQSFTSMNTPKESLAGTSPLIILMALPDRPVSLVK